MIRRMKTIVRKVLKWYLITMGVTLVLFWALWIYLSAMGLPLSPWHTYVPDEMTASELERADWPAYLAREDELMEAIRRHVTDRVPEAERLSSNRYYDASPLHPEKFETNWNRSYVMHPAGEPVGTVVLLHGLTDSPYSLRHIAEFYRDNGFVAVGIRLPGHGTVPGALTRARVEMWTAATRLAVRTATAQAEESAPLHLVGYSNGGALAMAYALDALADDTLHRPDRLILISPMIGITRMARFAGIASVPAILPAFARTAWQTIQPEYNPFKYNSFPINAARQSYRLTEHIQSRIQKMYDAGTLIDLPPVLTFQSVLDHTVSTPAIFYYLYEHLPENGSEMVLFDVNRTAGVTPLMTESAHVEILNILPPLPLPYALGVVTNADAETDAPSRFRSDTSVRTYRPGDAESTTHPLGITYPTNVYSLSHVAIPFPTSDELYGTDPPPDSDERFGVNLGVVAARGERGTLMVDMDALYRMSSNPFFSYLLERIQAGIDDPAPQAAPKPHIKRDPSPDLRKEETMRLMEKDS